MNCPVCDTASPADAVFCPKCGHRLADPTPGDKPQEKSGADKFKDMIAARTTAADENERELWHGGFSPKAMIGYWLLALLTTIVGITLWVTYGNGVPASGMFLTMVLIAVWGGMIAYYYYQRHSIEYTLTNQRLVHRSGILTRSTNRVEVIDIDDVRFEQSFIERFLGIGTIQLLSTDVSDPALTMRGIDNVKVVAKTIDDVRRQERRKRGLHIETV